MQPYGDPCQPAARVWLLCLLQVQLHHAAGQEYVQLGVIGGAGCLVTCSL